MPNSRAAQLNLFETPRAASVARPDPDFSRRHMNSVLWTLRRAEQMPWPEYEVRKWEDLFPQLALDLPEEEGRALCDSFAAELARLRAV